MTNKASDSQRFHILDASRGIAALGVLIFHVFYPSPMRQFMGLYVLVDFFFVLSGFVLYPSMPRHLNKFAKDGPRFILSRIVRLWPTVIASVVASMGLYWWKQFSASRSDSYFQIDPNRSPSLIAAAFFLLQILIPLSGAIFIVVPFWSLSAEWLSNIIFAPLTLMKYQIGIILGIGIGYFSLYYGLVHDSEWISSLGPIRGWQALGRALIGFGIGLLIRANLDRLLIIRNRVGLLITVALTIWASTIWQSYTFTHLYFVSPLFGLLILQLTQIEFSSVGKAAKISTFLGTYSYGVYAFHLLALEFYDYNVFRLNEFAEPSEWWRHLINKAIVVTIASTLATFLTLKLIDQPLQRRGRALIRKIFTPTT
jgi:peptidoglycan/LPS O-acetylase OafA/YrhL